MAVSINWGTREILVPRADMLLLQASPEERELALNDFRLELKTLEASEEGAPFPDTNTHNTEVSIGSLVLARTFSIINNYFITFEAGPYAVLFSGANTNAADVTTVNGVSIRPSNSAGLVGSREIENQSYLDGNIFINTQGSGDPLGKGTPTDPVDSYTAGYTIGSSRNLNGYNLNGSLTLSNTDTVTRTRWISDSPDNGDITFSNAAIDKCTFRFLDISGTIGSGRATFFDCLLGLSGDITNFDGYMDGCGIAGTIKLNPASTQSIVMRNGISLVAGAGKPIIDCDLVTSPISIRRQTGGLEIINFNGGGDMSIDAEGVLRLKIASTCTAGTIVVGGNVLIDDQSGVGCTVIRGSAVQDLIWDKTLP